MRYIAAADTDIGIHKSVNQDSLCIKIAEIRTQPAALVMVCDGMGGLSCGEIASADVINSFSDWFENEFPTEALKWDWNEAAFKVIERLHALNEQLITYGARNNMKLGTTATGIVAYGSRYLMFHVGDTRIYKISDKLRLLTTDHTYIKREMELGNMTEEQAKTDPRRNALLQCIGAAGEIEPQVRLGNIEFGANYMICSDGFRHVITPKEIFEGLHPDITPTKTDMKVHLRELIETVKLREERDNITAVMFRAER